MNSNILVIGNQLTIYMGLLPDIAEHSHTTAVIALSLNEESIGARNRPEKLWRDHQAYFIHAEASNEMRLYGNPIACIFIEPDSDLHQRFIEKHSFEENRLFTYQYQLNELKNILNTFSKNPTCPDKLSTTVINTILGVGVAPSRKEFDQRVITCSTLIKDNIGDNLSSQDLANAVSLSERQLSTLFKQDMGLPIRKYRLWLRLKNVARLVDTGRMLTDAAIDSGFSDSAHFANSCKKLLGLKPTDIMATNKPLTLFATSDFV